MTSQPRLFAAACLTVALAGIVPPAAQADGATQCPPPVGVALQVLGSGGPIADDGRASSAYLIWVDGKSRVLIDAGGGAFLRFGEAGASFDELDFVGISHFHTDHSADLPALLKSGYFSGRKRRLGIAGPSGKGPFPGIRAFLSSLLHDEEGAYRYLSGYLDGSDGLARLVTIEIDGNSDDPLPKTGDERAAFTVSAMHVPHGIVPALAFRVGIGNSAIVFAGDQNGDDPRFVEFARAADVLVMHMPVPLGPDRIARRLHAPPDVIARIAVESGADTLLLSHFMARSLRDLERNTAPILAAYGEHVQLAEDLDCIALADRQNAN